MTNFAVTFPGQGSQSVGMLADLAESYPLVKATFEEASDALGKNLWLMSQEGPAEELNMTANTQPAMLTAGIAVWRVLQEQTNQRPEMLAGHSLGEYTAMVASGVIDFADAVKLVAARGEFMQTAVPSGQGAMAAILGLTDDQVRDVCEQAAQGEVASAVNFNSPGQVVIAGNAAAIARAIELATEAGAKRALPLDVSVPSHCALMKPAAEQLSAMMSCMPFNAPAIPVIQNVNVTSTSDIATIQNALAEQLYSPVRWVETIESISDEGIETIIEAGPGKVLSGLCKRIDKSLTALPVLCPASLEKALENING
jgi:[acyl-carrier-protein] S-malonyltransferase